MRTPPSFCRIFACLALFCLSAAGVALAKNTPEFTEFGHNINIGPNEQTGDLTCFGCSIRVRGQVAGDVTTIGGSIVLEDPAQVAGDVTAIAGNMRLNQNVKVSGDTTVIGGDLRRDPQAMVSGDVTSMGGHGWFIPILLAPFIVLGLLVAFVIWLVQRMRAPSAPAAAA
jgi:hypothetical protein